MKKKATILMKAAAAARHEDTGMISRAAAAGAIVGMRSMVAPALLSHSLVTHPVKKAKGPARWLSNSTVRSVLAGLAVAELVADKLPLMPRRTRLPILVPRVAIGALAGAAMSTAARREWWPGAIAGAAGAAAASFAMCGLRNLADDAGAPRVVAGLAEDALTIGLGRAVLVS